MRAASFQLVSFLSMGESCTAQSSVISAEATLGSILVQACNIALTDSQLITSTGWRQPQYTTAGQITLSGKSITLTNGQILSWGVWWVGRHLDIRPLVLHRNVSSVIDASSTLGTVGTVTINGVIQP